MVGRLLNAISKVGECMEDYLLTSEIVFDSKPDAVPYNYRISYKISQICLIISKSCSGRSGCSLVKLHIISNALNTKEYMEMLNNFANDKISYMLVKFDPAVNRAIKYAIADELIFQLKNGTLRLTDKGKKLIDEINKSDDLLYRERQYLSTLDNKLTNDKIEKLMSLWRCNFAEDK